MYFLAKSQCFCSIAWNKSTQWSMYQRQPQQHITASAGKMQQQQLLVATFAAVGSGSTVVLLQPQPQHSIIIMMSRQQQHLLPPKQFIFSPPFDILLYDMTKRLFVLLDFL